MLRSLSPLEAPMRSWEVVAGATRSVGPGRTSGCWAHWQPPKKSLLPQTVTLTSIKIQLGRGLWMCQSQSSNMASFPFTKESREEEDATTNFSTVPTNVHAAEREVHRILLKETAENFSYPVDTNSASTGSTFSTLPSSHRHSTSAQDRAMARVVRLDEKGHLPPRVLYLLDLGMDLDSIQKTVYKYPAFGFINVDRKIKPVVDLLLDLGISKHNIPKIIRRTPQLFGISLTKNLKPTMLYLESVGIDRTQWAKVITRSPFLLINSHQKIKSFINFLLELGVPEDNIGKILTRSPNVLSCSLEKKLRPVSEYFTSLGVDVANLIQKCPQNFGLSIEDNLKPVTEFFVERGFSIAEIGLMVNRLGSLYMLSLEKNLVPKWEYFLMMGYPRSELVKFPHYFGYNMEMRIKPRFNRVRECGLTMSLGSMLAAPNNKFEDMLEKKMKKLNRLTKINKQRISGKSFRGKLPNA